MFNYDELKKFPRQKDGIFSKLYVNRLSPVFLYFIKDKKISPNIITFISFIIGLISCLLFFIPNNKIWIISGLLLQLSFIIDGLDGSYARYSNQMSYYGGWFDRLFDRIVDTLAIAFMSLSFYIHYNDYTILLFLFLAILTNFIFWANYDTMTITGMFTNADFTKYPENWFIRIEQFLLKKDIRFVFSRDVYLFVILLGALFFNPYISLLLIIVFKNLNTIIKYHLYLKSNKDNEELHKLYE